MCDKKRVNFANKLIIFILFHATNDKLKEPRLIPRKTLELSKVRIHLLLT
ncbi:hypothetical protein YERSI8AC_220174 [Enterobacterales bacterium 8AC]|nr:hypothetical protein YERSI8AC_220174 [Enterobacterales bacterium 8AC]